jgi:hypothetical protein
MKHYLLAVLMIVGSCATFAATNALTPDEKQDGWILLFDGKSLNGWRTDKGESNAGAVEHGSLNPHKAGGYMMVHEKKWGNFILSLDFKISPGCNSGIFVRTSSLTPRSGKDVGYNGIEIAIDDTQGAGYHDTGAIYDLSRPSKNAAKAAGDWNHIEITSKDNMIQVNLNGEDVNRIDLDQFSEIYMRPDGTKHKFDVVYKDHPRIGYIGIQDHGSDIWYRNIKLKPLD